MRTALQDAASIASLIVTTEALIAELPKEKPGFSPPGGGVISDAVPDRVAFCGQASFIETAWPRRYAARHR